MNRCVPGNRGMFAIPALEHKFNNDGNTDGVQLPINQTYLHVYINLNINTNTITSIKNMYDFIKVSKININGLSGTSKGM